jgi:quinol monooxygenase YgiN
MSPPADAVAGELFVFVRFHALPERESAVAAALGEVVPPTRAEPGNLSIHAFSSVRDSREFYIHSRWRDEAAFEIHSTLPHTRRFIETVEPLIDHELKVSRTLQIG